MELCSLLCSVILVINLASLGRNENQRRYEGRYSRQIDEYEVVVPRKVTRDGKFISNLIPHHYKRSYYHGKEEKNMGPDDKIHYRISIQGEDHHLELWPNNDLLSPGLVIETRKASQGNNSHNKAKSTSDFMSNLHIRRARDVQCHYKGKIRDHENSFTALSTCYGLAGLVRTKRGYYIIEPVKEHNPLSEGEHPHILYREDAEELESNCGTKGNLAHILATRAIREMGTQNLKKKKGAVHRDSHNDTVDRKYLGHPLYVEMLIVLDNTLIKYHKALDVENYVMTVMNMAYNLFHDASLGIPINLAIVKIIRLEAEDDEMNLAVTKNAEKTLNVFCDWQKKMNPDSDCHPNHHDVAVLITRTDICADDGDCGMLGISKLGGTCDPLLSGSVCEDAGLKLGYVVAHELAHTLGIDHDGLNVSGCNGTLPNDMYTVMNPAITMKIEGWSMCSHAYLSVFIDSGFATCLRDAPADHNFNIVDILPGVMYGADFQCRTMLSPSAIECNMGLTCDSLNCEIPGYGCMQTHVPPAPGTRCGEKKWCYSKKCLTLGERPGTVDGGWGVWSSWSHCSRTCGSGIAYAERQCDNPMPKGGGKGCAGNRKKHRICSSEPCSVGQPIFRDVQCSKFNKWVYPEDEKVHTWKGHFIYEENPCKLICKSDTGVIAVLKTAVVDGTTCFRGIRDICIGGMCREIPCDLDLESKAVEDRCGVCHGNGAGCAVTEGITFFQQNKTGMQKVIDVPVKATNIRVEETEPTDSLIVVTLEKDTKELIGGDALGMLAVPGSKAWLGMIKGRQEALNIPGPVAEPLVVWVKPLENVSIHYSLGIPTTEKRKMEFYWDFLDWNKCSTQCGPGSQICEARCVEKEGGMVDDKYCSGAGERPQDKSRPCELGPCVPRWSTSDWQECKHVSNSCEHTRMVNCVRPTGEGEGETVIISESECDPPRPKTVQRCPCEKRTKRLNDRRKFEDEKYLQHFIYEQNRNPDEDPDENVLQILGINEFQKDKKTGRALLPKRSCVGKNKNNNTNDINEIKKHLKKGQRGQIIIDREGINETKVTVLLDKHAGEELIKIEKPGDLPIPENNETSITLSGNDTLHLIQKIQNPNTTRKMDEKGPS